MDTERSLDGGLLFVSTPMWCRMRVGGDSGGLEINRERDIRIAAGHRRTFGTSDAKSFKILAQVKGTRNCSLCSLSSSCCRGSAEHFCEYHKEAKMK